MSYDYNLTRDWDKIEAQHDFEEQLYDHQWQLCWSDIVITRFTPLLRRTI
jgi:hypothetical protein